MSTTQLPSRGTAHDATGQATHEASTGGRGSFRPEIQGLRAVAVGLVVLYHLWPRRVTGGYVGVDVFFVISGFLITSHLLREVDQSGTVRLGRFWARRIRRLLPASLLVLALSAVAVYMWAPPTVWADSARQIAASALYVQNWALAFDAVDYMALDNVPTVAQHYWSLSVEEQFYLVWPILIIALLALERVLARRRGRHVGRHAATHAHRWSIGAGLGLLALASLVWSGVSTAADQSYAYMSTFTRVWEFAAGALAAVIGVRLSQRWAAAVGWLGIAGIVTAGLVFTDRSAFPGWIALLPVLGTVAVIAAGLGGPRTAGWWLARRPATFVGDISYSVYLVHWPLIVVVPYATGHALTWSGKLAILVASLVLAWGSKVFVEDPMRTGPLLSSRPWRAYAFAAAGMSLLLAANVGFGAELDRREAQSAQVAAARVASEDPCLGPGVLDARNHCGDIDGPGSLVAQPEVVKAQSKLDLYRECQRSLDGAELITCQLGAPGASRKAALIGDSHAGALVPTLDTLGKDHGFSVVAHTKGSCPYTEARRVLATETSDAKAASCDSFNEQVERSLLADRAITDIFVTSYSSDYTFTSRPGVPLANPAVDGFARAYQRLAAAGKRVHVVRDVPRTNGTSVPSCIATNLRSPERCAVPRDQALPDDIAVTAADKAGNGVSVIDLTDQLCDDRLCYALLGDVIVYRDTSHLSVEFARLLAPYVAEDAHLG